MKPVLTVVFTLIAFLVFTPSTSHRASAAPSCDIVGRATRDVIAGGKGGETICLLGGDDYGHGNGGRDRLRGGTGRDSLIGGNGRDKLKGGPGPDRLIAVDQHRGNDVLRGGSGFDHCHADPNDIVRGCEQVHRGNIPATTDALTTNSLQVTEIAENALEATPTPAPAPGGAPGATFPPCAPPPPDQATPAPCP